MKLGYSSDNRQDCTHCRFYLKDTPFQNDTAKLQLFHKPASFFSLTEMNRTLSKPFGCFGWVRLEVFSCGTSRHVIPSLPPFKGVPERRGIQASVSIPTDWPCLLCAFYVPSMCLLCAFYVPSIWVVCTLYVGRA